ncbi:MAG: hypothetical protein K2M03_08270 [Muribaculaceae bacterium]|nr:hypothetical protein [Muribaculaceae bacterium]
MKFLIIFNPDTPDAWSVLPDSVGLQSERPLFVPDFEDGACACPAVAVKLSRLGKCIERRFAGRYWQETAPAIVVMPRGTADKIRDGVTPDVTELCFDSSIVTGTFAVHDDISFSFDNSGTQRTVTQDKETIDKTVEQLSELNTLKTGDIILLLSPHPFVINENDIITADSPGRNDLHLLRTKIK